MKSDPTTLPARAFATTHWSLVLRAGDRASDEAEAALGHLYQIYSRPLYTYIRRQGHSIETALDLVQEVFLALLEKDQLASVSPQKGRFRSYLMAAANHLLANEWHRQRRQKRGGGRLPLALETLTAEESFRPELSDPHTPEVIFEKRWALALLDQVVSQLRAEWTTAGKAELFTALQGFLSGNTETPSYAEVGQRLAMTEGAARVAVHRLRQRYRDLLRQEIAQTVADPKDLEDEVSHLLAVLRR
ncbi:MAG: sigma-70 family RNA polymerase sigma factor [Verrucomicrobiales bacterium]|nr:sigma-70 family RNA polymerase sigma factor [Verrucomicrobiales bacterium]